VATPLLVPFIEEGWTEHPALKAVLREYLGPLLEKGIDTLVLGCTHYPLLVPQLRKLLGRKVRLVDSASTCAGRVAELLRDQSLLRAARARPSLEIYLTDLSEQAEAMVRRFLGAAAGRVQKAML
jgi:glutamate racemase